MKKLLYILFSLISLGSFGQGAFQSNGRFAPTGNYFITVFGESQTGFWPIARYTQRDSIPQWQLTQGMIVYAADRDSCYQLTSVLLRTWYSFKLGSAPVSSVNGLTGAVSLTTSNISEGSNLYYTDARARAALSFSSGTAGYNSTTGVISIPTNNNQLTNGGGYISNITGLLTAGSNTSLSGSGTSGSPYVVNIPQSVATTASPTFAGLNLSGSISSQYGGSNFFQIVGANTGHAQFITIDQSALKIGWGSDSYRSGIENAGEGGGNAGMIIRSYNANIYLRDQNDAAAVIKEGVWNGSAIADTYISSASIWNSKQGAITLTTTGSSGAATFSGNTLNIPTYTLAGLGGISGNQTITLGGILSGSGTTSITAAAASGYYMPTTTDQSNWNGKQAALSGTGFVKISGTTISYDNSTYLTANQNITLSGDITGSGTTAITGTLATVNSNTGSWGGASSVPTFTVNGKGLITAAGNTSIQIAESQVTNLVSDLAGKQAAITNGMGFLKNNGSGVFSYDNSTYLTTSAAASTYQPLENQRLSTTNSPIFAGGTYNGLLYVNTANGVESINFSGVRGTSNGVSQVNLYDRLAVGFSSGWNLFPNAPADGILSLGNIQTNGSFIKTGGTSSQFLKADGSVDGNNYLPLTGGTLTGSLAGTSASFSTTANNFSLESTGTSSGEISRVKLYQNSSSSDIRSGVIEWYKGGSFSGDLRLLASGGIDVHNPSDQSIFNINASGVANFKTSLAAPDIVAGNSFIGNLNYTLTLGTDLSGTSFNNSANITANVTSTLQSVTGRGASTSNALTISNTTNATSYTTGALIISGGIGVAKDIITNGNIYANHIYKN